MAATSGRARTRRRGTIRQIRPSVWQVRVTLATDPVTRKQFRETKHISGTKSDAERYLTNRLGRLDSGEQKLDSTAKRQTLGGWLEEYWHSYSGNLRPRTKEKYQENLSLYLPEHLLATGSPRSLPIRFRSFSAASPTEFPMAPCTTRSGYCARASTMP